MVGSLESLFDQIFDYAGMFPPARLSMDDTVTEYMEQFRGRHVSMLGRLVVPSIRLPEFADYLENTTLEIEIPTVVIGQGSNTYDQWGSVLEEDAKLMTSFINRVGDLAGISAYEIRLPNHDHTERCLKDLGAFSEIDVFVETPISDGLEDSMAAIAVTEWIGAKARTGGLTADAFPTPEQLARFLHSAMSVDIPFKLTAGLHHPFPVRDSETGGNMHGFVNVLTACALSVGYDLSRNEMAQVLKDRESSHWRIRNDGFDWGDTSIGMEEIEAVRDVFVAIGSCSIEEPVSDLQELGWLV